MALSEPKGISFMGIGSKRMQDICFIMPRHILMLYINSMSEGNSTGIMGCFGEKKKERIINTKSFMFHVKVTYLTREQRRSSMET